MDDSIASLTRDLSCCDEHAWRAFHERYFDHLRSLAIARGAAECDAPEIVQGVYLRVLRHAKVFPDAAAFDAWLACLTRCEVIDATRRKGRRSWLNERFQQWQEMRRATVEDANRGNLEEAMLVLSENERTLVTQHYLNGWSQEELAKQHRISVKAVESRLARLRKRLRQSMENQAPI